ncbi:GntR family transcriptional regulator [Reyranella sp.]|uniref:GntR family transcriptional regulator n=1 Tax=Reyranella sp. TaxID=1929291 RepID=UPI003BA927CB
MAGRRARQGAVRRRKGDVATDSAVYDAIRQAMLSGRLRPGTKLQEPVLARLLKVSRERVRKALHRLVHERWLETVPNRGTFVPAPSVVELRGLYEVRALLEDAVVSRLAAKAGNGAASRLRAHIARERAAVKAGDRSRLFGLSTEFHALLADLCGNEPLAQTLRALLPRSSLHFSLFAPPAFDNCAGPHDHGDIVKAVLAGDGGRARTLMREHLGGLVDLLAVQEAPHDDAPLEEIFRDGLGERPRAGRT